MTVDEAITCGLLRAEAVACVSSSDVRNNDESHHTEHESVDTHRDKTPIPIAFGLVTETLTQKDP
eukprot:5512470-Amphidinium_carterae.1